MSSTRNCWCGHDINIQFSEYYMRCEACNTLISISMNADSYYKGSDDGSSLYGKDYWFQHMRDLGFPDIRERARNDLAERNLYWLREILKYRLPPAKSLELGCCHGGSVYLMRMAGYDAIGSEMSQWICSFAQETFGVPMVCGPIEEYDLPPSSLDMIVLMDVFEHLADPVATLETIYKLLNDNGMIVLQTPSYDFPHKSYNEIQAQNDPFLDQLKEDEHIYIYNKKSIECILKQTGFKQVAFEKPIFPYDMFVFAGKESLVKVSHEAIVEEMTKTPERRVVLALLELYWTYFLCEQDRIAKQQVIDRVLIEGELQSKKYASQVLAAYQKEILNSYSWKLTAPLRKIADLLK